MKRYKLIIIVLLACLATAPATAQKGPVLKQKFNWGREQDTTSGYTQAIKVDNVIYISGTVSTEITPEGIRNLYSNLESTLRHYGAGFQHVVKENLYTTDIEAMKRHNAARKAFYKGDYPAATWVQISRLFMPEAKLEVELVAHLPEEDNE